MKTIGSNIVNEANVVRIETGVTAQPPGGKPFVTDAVRIHFAGQGTPPLTLFGDDATAAVDAFGPAPAPAAPAVTKAATSTPTPTPAPTTTVKV